MRFPMPEEQASPELSVAEPEGSPRRRAYRAADHARRHARRGSPFRIDAQFLGHTDVATTRRIYARFSPSYLKKGADALEL